MHFSTATIIAALAANVLAIPVPQIGGEAQLCQNALDGVVAGVSSGTGTALTNTAGVVSSAKGSAKLKYKLVRRQGTGAAAACYDVVNNVDQGSGYTTGNLLDGATGNTGEECTTEACTTQNSGSTANSKRQVDAIANGVQAISGAAGTGAETASVTGAASGAADEINTTEENVGAELGTAESYPTSDAGAEIGNAIGGAVPHARRQLNKIAPGVQNVANEAGVGAEAEPVTAEENNLDGIGTGDVGELGTEIGGIAQTTGTEAGQAVPNSVPKM